MKACGADARPSNATDRERAGRVSGAASSHPALARFLRGLAARDASPNTRRSYETAVGAYLESQSEVIDMLTQIEGFLRRWLPAFEADQRSYLTVAIGCTGGQHRSVWFAERLARSFGTTAPALVRHRELDAAH